MPVPMSRPSSATWLGLAAGVAALFLTPTAPAQPKDDIKEEVTITTVDGVELKATYYKSKKGKDGPVALFLHDFGKDRTKGDWDKLAMAMHDSGFAVLTFDFRGHGGSTSITPSNFWGLPQNAPGHMITGGSAKKTTISYKDFRPNYHPYLTNDIAAARHFLDKKNDAGACNTSSIFVVGDQEGAALGMLWIATEWQRPGAEQKFGGAMPASGGQDIAGAIWLSAKHPAMGGWSFSRWYQISPQARDKVPMCFFYGEQDGAANTDADYFLNQLLKQPTGSTAKRPEDTFKYAIKTSLHGIDLLGKPNLKSDEYLAHYVEKVMSKRGGSAVWQQRGTVPEQLVNLSAFGVGN